MAEKDNKNLKKDDFTSAEYYNLAGGVSNKSIPGYSAGNQGSPYYSPDPLAAGGVQVTRGGTYEKPVLPMEDYGAFQRGFGEAFQPPVPTEPPTYEELEFDWNTAQGDEDDFFTTTTDDRVATKDDISGGLVLKEDNTPYTLEEYNALSNEDKNKLQVKGKKEQWKIGKIKGLENNFRENILEPLSIDYNNCPKGDQKCRDEKLKKIAGYQGISTGLQSLVDLSDADLNDINVSTQFLPGLSGKPDKNGITIGKFAEISSLHPSDVEYGSTTDDFGDEVYGLWVYDRETKKKHFINTSAVDEQYGVDNYKVKYDQSGAVQKALQKDGSMEGFGDVMSRRNEMTYTECSIGDMSLMVKGKKVQVTKNFENYITDDYYRSGYVHHRNGAKNAFSTVNDPNLPSAWNQTMQKFKNGTFIPDFGITGYENGQPIQASVNDFNSGQILNVQDFEQLKRQLRIPAGTTYNEFVGIDSNGTFTGNGLLQKLPDGAWNNVNKELMLKMTQDHWAETSKITNDNHGYLESTNGRAETRNSYQYKIDNNLLAVPQGSSVSVNVGDDTTPVDYENIFTNVDTLFYGPDALFSPTQGAPGPGVLEPKGKLINLNDQNTFNILSDAVAGIAGVDATLQTPESLTNMMRTDLLNEDDYAEYTSYDQLEGEVKEKFDKAILKQYNTAISQGNARGAELFIYDQGINKVKTAGQLYSKMYYGENVAKFLDQFASVSKRGEALKQYKLTPKYKVDQLLKKAVKDGNNEGLTKEQIVTANYIRSVEGKKPIGIPYINPGSSQ